MRGAESVVDINVRQRRQRLGEFGIVLGFFLVEADVFDNHDLARLESRRHGVGLFPDDVGGELDLAVHQLGQAFGHRGQGAFFLGFLILRTAQMGTEDHRRAVIHQILDGGNGFPNALIVRNDTVVERHVEVAAHQHLFSLDVDVFNGLFIEVVHA